MTAAAATPQIVKPHQSGAIVWLGLIPFFLFAILFLFLPSASLFIGSLTDSLGHFSLVHIVELFSDPSILNAYWLSISISAVTAVGGGIVGFLLAYAVTVGGLPKPLRPALITFSGVASNFAGVPLAFAFVATLGRTGFITALLKTIFGVNIYNSGFNLYSFAGLSLTYMYFQFPLMVLIMAPALDGLRREWREAAQNLGASSIQYWWKVGLPILLPSILGSMILLFGNGLRRIRHSLCSKQAGLCPSSQSKSERRSAGMCYTMSAWATPWRLEW